MVEPEPLQQLDRTYVCWRGRKLSYFSGCDYFRLASHPKVLAAFKRAADSFGINVAASRFTTGNHKLYRQLEIGLARFFGAPEALLVSSGYVTNIAVAQALAGSFSHALLDARAHPSLQDAAQGLKCPVLTFQHQQSEDLEACVKRCGPGSRVIVLTDGTFAYNGSVAPLPEYLRVLPRDALILVDDAHGAGVVGPQGRGTLDYFGLGRQRIVQTITLSKALGTYGGAILCSERLRRRLAQCREVTASTPIPLPLAAAALESLVVLGRNYRTLSQRSAANTKAVRDQLRSAGLKVEDHAGPIIAIVPPDANRAAKMRRALLAQRIFPPFIRYPGGPSSGYFRLVISSEHHPGQLTQLRRALRSMDLRGFSSL